MHLILRRRDTKPWNIYEGTRARRRSLSAGDPGRSADRVRTNGRVVPLLIAAAGDLIQSRNRCVGQLSTGDADNRCTGRLIRAIRYRECRMTADTGWHSM